MLCRGIDSLPELWVHSFVEAGLLLPPSLFATQRISLLQKSIFTNPEQLVQLATAAVDGDDVGMTRHHAPAGHAHQHGVDNHCSSLRFLAEHLDAWAGSLAACAALIIALIPLALMAVLCS